MAAPFDAFGRLCVDPGRLTQRQRVDVVRRLAGQLQAGQTHESRWLGSMLVRWLHEGGALEHVLGLRPQRGSHATAQAILRTVEQDGALMRLSVAAGGDRPAWRALQAAPCAAPSLREFVEAVRELNAPASVAAFGRARERVSRLRASGVDSYDAPSHQETEPT